MKVKVDTSRIEAKLKDLRLEIECAVDTVADVVREDAKQTERDFHAAGNTTTRSDENVGVLRSGNMVVERATGSEVLFKEFGTGMRYAKHPLANRRGAIRGGYGLGYGGQPEGWVFTEEPGISGEYASEIRNTGETSYYKTMGQPASMPMYNSFKRLSLYIPKAIEAKIK